ncbi:MAG: GGDEF domain-containing protein [Planctomycetes bacterium]|nr:GGDEF domain-containing protein [Planctomycetota bacterium]
MSGSDKTILFHAEELRARGLGCGREHAVLIVLDERKTSRRYEIKKAECTAGRDETCDIVLQDSNCSRAHAKFVFANIDDATAPPRVAVHDLQSTNGTFVNGSSVGSAELKSGDKILVGRTLLGFFLWDDLTLKAEDALLRSASTDGLTGLYNRGFFNSALAKEFGRAARYKRPLSLILMDLDHFKALNDAHGHTAGDRALREVGALLLRESRAQDLPCRYGGEEVALLMPETGLPGAAAHAQRLRVAVRDLSVQAGEAALRFTASFGVAAFEDWMREPDHLLRAADMALYRAKREGRDRVATHEGYGEESAPTEPLQG